MDVIRAAVIGVGNMGTAHAACLQEGKIAGMALCALVDTDAKRRAEIAQRFAGVPVFEDVDALLKNGCVDAAIVATPHPSHTSVAEKTLAAGLHTLVEKPVDVMLSRARHLCDAAGLTIRRLIRVSVGNLKLDGLASGKWRYLEQNEIDYLYRATKG